uniref:Degenerin del-1 n=1 Tax=Parascaris univalens TaxID=6257 RepID=A0A915ADX1_PARUN
MATAHLSPVSETISEDDHLNLVLIRELDMWEEHINRIRTAGPAGPVHLRKKRGVEYAPVFVRCTCLHVDTQCVPQRNPLKRNTTVCICFEDVSTGNIWPCYPTAIWAEKDRKDPIAITTKAKETLIFMVAALPQEVRKNISYNLHEFVLRCSFNSEDCNMERDFKLHMDPEYGNCYTFNFNDSVELKNTRAGPMYGLRLLLNVNQSDYLPTTEAAGVRLVVHEQKVLHRLDAPYGLCSDTFRPEGYIYQEHYSPEDFDVLLPENNCSVRYSSCLPQICDKMLEAAVAVLSGFGRVMVSLRMLLLYVLISKLNTAYIEIYYEQLNFESLKETAGYSIVNLFSDFGGNIGLWIGFSIITMMEIVELICEMAWYFFYRRPMQLLKRKKRRDENQLSRPQLHYRTDTPSVFSKTIEPSATMDSNLDFDDSEMTVYSARFPHR